MKKIFVLLVASLFTVGAFAAVKAPVKAKHHHKVTHHKVTHKVEKRVS